MTKGDLIRIFGEAATNNAEYIAVRISTVGLPADEIIINKYTNIDYKLEYYMNAYDDSLVLKSFDGIRITGIAWANTLNELEVKLDNEMRIL